MKIVQVIHDYWPNYKLGAENYTHDLAHQLAENQHKVLIFTVEPGALKEKKEIYQEGKVKVTKIHFPKFKSYFFKQTFLSPKMEKYFEEFIKREKPDIVHLEHLINHSLGYAKILVKHNIPFIYSIHDYWFKCPYIRAYSPQGCSDCTACINRKLKKQGWRGMLLKTLSWSQAGLKKREKSFKYLFDQTARVIVFSDFVKNQLIDFGVSSEKIMKVRPGLNSKLINLQISFPKDSAKSSSQLDQTDRSADPIPIRFGFLGHGNPSKGLELLINTFFKLIRENKKTNKNFAKPPQLFIFGKYSELSSKTVRKLKEMAKNKNVFLEGLYNHTQDLAKIMQKIDVVVIPSLWNETYNLVLDEARVFRKPVIVSNRGALPERVNHLKDGLIFDPQKPGSLTKALAQFINNQDLVSQLAKNSPPVHSMKEHSKKIQNLYRKILKEK